MIYVFDLDGTLCETDGTDYAQARPIPERIAKVKVLLKAGHTVLIDSARGSMGGEPWDRLTIRQLAAWGLSDVIVRTGVKFYGDVYVDDRGVSAQEFFSNGLAR